jgi:hypothetical protein
LRSNLNELIRILEMLPVVGEMNGRASLTIKRIKDQFDRGVVCTAGMADGGAVWPNSRHETTNIKMAVSARKSAGTVNFLDSDI